MLPRWIKSKPHVYFIASIVIIVTVAFINGKKTAEINVHDTYFVYRYLDLYLLIASAMGIIAIGYWSAILLKNKLSYILNLIHIAATFIGSILIVVLKQFYRESYLEYDFNSKLSWSIAAFVMIIFIAQILFIINIVQSFFRKRK